MNFDEVMAELKKEYIASIPEKLAAIKGHWESGLIDELRNDFHKLKGTGLTYGVPEVTDLALEMENICKTKPDLISELMPNAISLFEKIHQARVNGQELDLKTQPEFQKISP